MTLGELINRLRQENPNRVCAHGFGAPHSYRGDYGHLAFAPAENVTVAEMLASARSAVGAYFTGWKGGEYPMRESTPCHLAAPGTCPAGSEMENWIERVLWVAPPGWEITPIGALRCGGQVLVEAIGADLYVEVGGVGGARAIIPLTVIDRARSLAKEAIARREADE